MGKVKAQKPTQKQKVHISAAGKNPKDLLILEETSTEIKAVYRGSGEVITIKKEEKKRR